MLEFQHKIGFGGAGLGNLLRPMEPETAWQLCDEAWENGIRYFDTAPHYGLGLSEIRLGDFLRTRKRTEYRISTKVGRVLEPVDNPRGLLDLGADFHVRADYRRRPDYTPEGVNRSITDSLERMGLDHVDIAFVHDPEKANIGMHAALEQGISALDRLKDQGTIGSVGVGSMSAEALEAALEIGGIDTLMVAGRYTLLEQPALEVLDRAARTGVEVVFASVFNSGLLARPTPSPNDRYEYATVPHEVFERAVELARICSRYDVELPAAALQFPLRHPAGSALIAGIDAPGQCIENIARLNAPIPEELWAELQYLGLIPEVTARD